MKHVLKYALVMLLLELSCVSLYAGVSGIIEGTVKDAIEDIPLVGVNVVVDGSHRGAATDTLGNFKIYNVPAGVVRLRVSMIGYQSVTIENFTVLPNLKSYIDILLTPTIIEVDEIAVKAEKPLIRTDVVGSTHEINEKEIVQLPVDNYMDIVDIQPGVADGGHVRGGRESDVLYLIDGLPVRQSITGNMGSNIPRNSIQEMSIQTGGFDAEYGNALSSVVNIITKHGADKCESQFRIENDSFWGGQETNKRTEAEFSLSGPIKQWTSTYFISANWIQLDDRWWQDMRYFFNSPINRETNFIGKFEHSISKNLRLWYQMIYSNANWRDYEFRWRFNLDGLPGQRRESYLLNSNLSYNMTNSSFVTLNVSRYVVNSHIGPNDKHDLHLNKPFQYDFYLQYIVDGYRLWWADNDETRYTFKLDYTSQLSPRHYIKIGTEFDYYDLETDILKYEPQTTYFGKPIIDKPLLNFSTDYNYKPNKGAIYIQDKIEFSGKELLSIGLRYDYLDPQAERPMIEWIPQTNEEFEQVIKGKVPARTKHQWSPRLGFTMPLEKGSYIFLNFGLFFQVPLFEYLYSGLNVDLKKGHRVLVGNPDLKPEQTRMWEISYRKILNEDFVGTVTYFSKEIRNLVDTKTFLATDSKSLDDGFTQFVNLPYAQASGIEVYLNKKFNGTFGGKIAYTYMTARGLSESSTSQLDYLQWGFEPVPGDHYLSWDQRHTLNLSLEYQMPFDINLNVLARYHSPRPYTYLPEFDMGDVDDYILQPNNERMESNYYLDIKIRRAFTYRNIHYELYADVRNLFDSKNLLWVDSLGRPGGELGDPTAYDIGRRTRVGLRIVLGQQSIEE